MKIFDIPWITHNGGVIYSLDFHPNDNILATAGQSDNNAGKLTIWDISAIKKCVTQYGNDEIDSWALAKIEHQAGLNCVRWSSKADDFILACAGDEPIVFIYRLQGTYENLGSVGSSLFPSSLKTLHKYKCTYRLIGHTLDILHLDWSLDGRFLASCSIDSSVIVWNARKFPEKLIIIKEESQIKGISFDPVGRFLSTQSENFLKIWKTDGWQCIRKITEPFNEGISSTTFCRMDWTPNGSFLIAPCSMNNNGPTVQIISRKDWSCLIDFVGFRKATSCVRANKFCFNPWMEKSGDESPVLSCMAIGSRDRSVSIWLVPHFSRPILVLNKAFKDTVLDFSWSGYLLAGCSRAGAVRFFAFTKEELGIICDMEQMNNLITQLYGAKIGFSVDNSDSDAGVSDDFGYSSICDLLKDENRDVDESVTKKSLKYFPPKKKIPDDHLKLIEKTLRLQQKRKNESTNESTNSEAPEMISTSGTNLNSAPGGSNYKKRLLVALISSTNMIEANNDFRFSANEKDEIVAQIISYKKGNSLEFKPVWKFYIPDQVLEIAANGRWTVLSTNRSHLYILSTKTGRLLSNICFSTLSSSILLRHNKLEITGGRVIDLELMESREYSSIFTNVQSSGLLTRLPLLCES